MSTRPTSSPSSSPILQRLACLALTCLALLSTAGAQLELGGMTFLRAGRSRPLTATMTAAFNPGFFRAVGGVAFAGVAEGVELTVEHVAYAPDRPDGQRLVLSLRDAAGDSHVVSAALHDWELVPLARLAASDDNACVTLFGELDEPSASVANLAEEHRVINYHPALDDTLMGLRMLQGDLLAFVPQATDLFKLEGRYVLGGGEQAPSPADVRRNERRFASVQAWLDEQDQRFSSYVVCDKQQTTRFSLIEGQLVLEGQPIWDCWRHSDEYMQFHEEVADELMTDFFMDSMSMEEPALEARWTMEYIEARRAALEAERGGAPDPDASVTLMPEMTRELTLRIRKQGGINPVVYEALRTTMVHSALLRRVRLDQPEAFAALLRALAQVEVKPPVDTPNLMPAG